MPKFDLDEKTFLTLGEEILKAIYRDRPKFGVPFPKVLEEAKLHKKEEIVKLPLTPSVPQDVVNQILREIIPLNIPTHHPAFLSFIPSMATHVSTLGNLIAEGYNIFAGHWLAGGGAAQIESILLNWLKEIYAFPEQAGGIFVSGGSMANLTALVAARENKLGEDWEKGVFYYSAQTHSSWTKAAKILGFRSRQHRAIPTKADMKIDTLLLEQEIKKDKEQGLQPFCITGNAGTTNTGTVDDLQVLANIAAEYGLWYHIDGAYGAASILSGKRKASLVGIEKADSLTLDPHKWWFQNFELGCLLVKNKNTLRNAFQVGASYLDETKSSLADKINYYEYGPQLTRSFKALKFYLTLKVFGIEQMGQWIEKGIKNAEWIENELRKKAHWEICSKAQLGILTFRFHPQGFSGDLDQLNKKISRQIIEESKFYLLTTKIHHKLVLRICPIHPELEEQHLQILLVDLERISHFSLQ